MKVSQGDDNPSPPKSPPKPLLLVVPSVQGNYPVLLFLHGFLLNNNYYTQLLQHVASHGYITVAPQMDSSLFESDTTREIEDAVAVTKWLHEARFYYLPVEYGHMDFLDDKLEGVMEMPVDTLISIVCKHGTAREPMRSFTGGIMVAFLKAYLKKETEILDELVKNPSVIPVTVETPEYYLDKICV